MHLNYYVILFAVAALCSGTNGQGDDSEIAAPTRILAYAPKPKLCSPYSAPTTDNYLPHVSQPTMTRELKCCVNDANKEIVHY